MYILCTIFILTACSTASKSDMVSYAKKNFGKAKCINYEQNGDISVANMKDKQYGFSYTITSSMTGFNMDGTTFFQYEGKYSDFYERYAAFIQSTEEFSKVVEEYSTVIDFKDYSENIYVYISNAEKAKDTAIALANAFNKIDNRGYFTEKRHLLRIENFEGEFIGEYSFSDARYYKEEEVTINWFLSAAANSISMEEDLGFDRPKVDEMEYLYSEYMDASEIPGRNREQEYPYRMSDTDESLANTMVVHFMYQNKEWIVADCLSENSHLYLHCLE